jgi:hypothetical protein
MVTFYFICLRFGHIPLKFGLFCPRTYMGTRLLCPCMCSTHLCLMGLQAWQNDLSFKVSIFDNFDVRLSAKLIH